MSEVAREGVFLPGVAVPPRAAGVHAGLVLAAVLLVPVALYLAGQALLLRLGYPLLNLLLAAWLFAVRSPWFAGHCVLLFCFTSLVRRLADAQAGFDPSNPILLTPYACSLLAAFAFLSYWRGPQPRYVGAFLVVLGAVAYGTLLAVLQGRMIAGLVDALKWSIGPLLAVYALSRGADPRIREVVEDCLVWGGAAMGAYGIWQFVSPAAWDAEWMRGATLLGMMTSIGTPDPFSVRVFSTMNSPGSLGAMLSAGIILALKRRFPVALPALTLMGIGLALCQYRTIWAATALAVLMLVALRPRVVTAGRLLAMASLGFLAAATLVLPDVRAVIADRAATLLELRGDKSLESRRGQYQATLRSEESFVVGSGLGIAGSSRRFDRQPPVVIDSGLIEIARGLGVVAGAAFVLAILRLHLPLFGGGVPGPVGFDRAIPVATFVQLPMGSVHVGEVGVMAWLFLGLGLATVLAAAGDGLRSTS